MTTRVRLAGGVLVLALLLAGCVGGGSTTATPAETIAEDEIPSQEQLRAETLSAMSNVTAYSAEQNVTTVRHLESGTETIVTDVEYAVNRTSHSLSANRTETRGGVRSAVDRYVFEETLYQRSEQFREEHGSAWIQRDISDGFARQWHLYDQLWRYEFVLGNATLSDVETDVHDGSEVYVLDADVDTDELNTALREALNQPPGAGTGIDENTTISATFWIDSETSRPVKVTRSVAGTMTLEGQSVEYEREITSRLTYGNVSVTLPEGADDATVVGDE